MYHVYINLFTYTLSYFGVFILCDAIIIFIIFNVDLILLRWFRKEGDQLDALRTGPDSERRSLVGGSLLINAVTQQDTGVYVCAANSTAGIVTMEVEVRVISQLNVHILPPFLKVDSGAPAIFTCITSVSEVSFH